MRTVLDDLHGRVADAWASRVRFDSVDAAVLAMAPAGGYAFQRHNGEWTARSTVLPKPCETKAYIRVRRDGVLEAHTFLPGTRRTLHLRIGRVDDGEIRMDSKPGERS